MTRKQQSQANNIERVESIDNDARGDAFSVCKANFDSICLKSTFLMNERVLTAMTLHFFSQIRLRKGQRRGYTPSFVWNLWQIVLFLFTNKGSLTPIHHAGALIRKAFRLNEPGTVSSQQKTDSGSFLFLFSCLFPIRKSILNHIMKNIRGKDFSYFTRMTDRQAIVFGRLNIFVSLLIDAVVARLVVQTRQPIGLHIMNTQQGAC